MNTINITNARKDLYKIVRQVVESHEPIHITGKQGDAVIISVEDWKNIQETLYLTSVPGMRKSIIEGINTDIENCSQEIKW
jgi:prevent-host-death family protein